MERKNKEMRLRSGSLKKVEGKIYKEEEKERGKGM